MKKKEVFLVTYTENESAFYPLLFAEEDTVIIADPEQLRRVINNIVSNSAKYMDKKSKTIHLRVKDVGDFVQVEIEDNGKGISFNVFCYNTQPSIKIDYKTGESYLIVTPTTTPETSDSESNIEATYILNTNSKKFHTPSCSSVNKMSDKNKQSFTGDKNDLIAQGYSACGICKP